MLPLYNLVWLNYTFFKHLNEFDLDVYVTIFAASCYRIEDKD
jgi:hypothetical protein